jgi:hypothetical protein
MIGITFNVVNIATVIQAYDQIQVIRYDTLTDTQPETPVGQPIVIDDWTVVSGTVGYPFPIDLTTGVTVYMGYDPDGEATDWYSYRYYDSSTGAYSAWSEPMLGSEGDLYYDPIYPEEVTVSAEDQAVIDRIRLYIGDPKGLRREFGEEALASLHPDFKTFELAEKGWPVYITMGGVAFNSLSDPVVNGYKYLRFQEPVDDICYTCAEAENLCGDTETKLLTKGIDIWYRTFRNSDKEILAAYDNVYPPVGLTTTTATTQAYILQTAIDILTKELFEDLTEDGARVGDDRTSYDPEPGLGIRKDLLDGLKKDLDELVKSLKMSGISGVLID